MGRSSKKVFRDGSYYAKVWVGKRTVKEGECAAVWTAMGNRKVVEGPRRVRLLCSHVRFMDRAVADGHQFLAVKFRDGRVDHLRGPCSLFVDPCVHERVEVKQAYKLAANEAVVVYRESRKATGPEEVIAAAASKETGITSTDEKAIGRPASVERRIVKGPAVYVPTSDEWLHTFSWHGTPRAGRGPGEGSKTGLPNDDKVPHALSFQTLRLMPDQMYYTCRDVRTQDDAQIAVHLMLFYELKDLEKMLDATNDPIGDFINATSADVMMFGASNTYESLLERTEQLSDLATFPTVRGRMASTGYELIKVVYRGYTTSHKLQAMHDDSIAKRTALRLQSATARVEQAEQAMQLRCREERAEGERALASAAAKHCIELDTLEKEQQRQQRDEDHAQRMRHERETAEEQLRLLEARNNEDVRRAAKLKELGVDLTKLLCTMGDRLPDKHVRIDSATPTAVHLDMTRK